MEKVQWKMAINENLDLTKKKNTTSDTNEKNNFL